MKKSVHILVCVLMITLFSACYDGREQAEQNRTYLTSRPEVCYRAQMRLHLGEEVRDYTLRVSHTGEQTALSVIEPAALAGLGAVVTGEKMTLTYDDVVFAGERVDDGLPSPLFCFPLLWEALESGTLTMAEKNQEGLETELLCYYEEVEYTLRVRFDGETGLVRHADVGRGGETLAEIEVEGYETPSDMILES